MTNLELHLLQRSKGQSRSKKRVGRGIGSGKGGHTTGRGTKGQKARVGYNLPIGFEGGQVPLYKKLPQIGGFKNYKTKKVITVALSKLKTLETTTEITPKSLLESGFIVKLPRYTKVKLLGDIELTKKFNFKGFLFSESAKNSIEKAGGKIES